MSEKQSNRSLETYRDGFQSADARYAELWRYL